MPCVYLWSRRQVELDPVTGDVKAGGKNIPFSDDVVLGDGSIEHRIMWTPIGDASESAMIKFCQPMRDIIEYRGMNPVNEKGNTRQIRARFSHTFPLGICF